MSIFRRRTGADLPADQSLAMIARTLRVLAIVASVGLILWLLNDLVLELFVVAMLSLLLRGLGELLAKIPRLPISLAVAIVTLGLVLLSGISVYYRGPHFIAELQDLYEKLSPAVASLEARYGSTSWGQYLISHLRTGAKGLEGPAVSVLGISFGLISTLVVVVLAATYIAAAPRRYLHGVVLMFPPETRAQVSRIMRDCGHALQWWMLGQAIDMLAVATISTVGLLILHVPLPYTLGTLAGLFTFVPYFGAWIGSVPAILMALTVNTQTAIWTVCLFLLCHLVEGYLLAPLVQRRTVDLPPAVTLLSMSIVGSFYGLAGVALATPIAAVALVVVQEAYIERARGPAENTDAPNNPRYSDR